MKKKKLKRSNLDFATLILTTSQTLGNFLKKNCQKMKNYCAGPPPPPELHIRISMRSQFFHCYVLHSTPWLYIYIGQSEKSEI